jgi:hypothetical protein
MNIRKMLARTSQPNWSKVVAMAIRTGMDIDGDARDAAHALLDWASDMGIDVRTVLANVRKIARIDGNSDVYAIAGVLESWV